MILHCQRAALYCAVLQVVVSGALDYSRPEVQRDMEELLGRLENTTYIDPLYTESWLRSFLDYVQRWKDYPDYYELNVDDEQSFIKTLKDVSISGAQHSLPARQILLARQGQTAVRGGVPHRNTARRSPLCAPAQRAAATGSMLSSGLL